MKLISTALFAAIFAASALAQDFEGTIVWTFRAEITDPAMQQDMQQGMSVMSDPETMKEMQDAMNDPDVQAMMAANPQMKAMMQRSMGAAMGMARGGNPMQGLFPTGMSVRIKGGNSLVVTEGGMNPSEELTIAGKPETYSIDRPNRTYRVIQPMADDAGNASRYRITRTDETATILNLRARKYLVEETGGGDSTFAVWTTTELRGLDPSRFARMRVGRGSQADFMSQLEGVPLRMEISSPEMKMTMEATSVRRESLSDDLFRLPPGFSEQK